MSSVDNDENEKEEGERELKKSKFCTPVSSIEHDVTNDVIFDIESSEVIENEEQVNHYKVKKNIYE